MVYPISLWSRIFRIKGTVILHTWWQILCVLIFTVFVVSYHFHIQHIKCEIAILVDILGIVTGLLLAFRTQTSYERYWQGRTLWADMTLEIRNLTRLVWISVVGHDSITIVEKKSVVNLLLAFAISVKHHLRQEFGYKHADMKDLLTHIVSTKLPPTCELTSEAYLHRSFDDIITTHRDVTRSNIPLEISHYISTYVHYCSERNRCDRTSIAAMHKGVSNLVGCLTALEKIHLTPIPVAYSVHLTHLAMIYTLAIPFQIVDKFGWYTLVIVGLVAFSFLGILEIGQEIENPFSYEANDLPLDKFCAQLAAEIDLILAQSPSSAHQWIFSEKNQPFLPWSYQTAIQLKERTPEELMSIISRCGVEDKDTTGGVDKSKPKAQSRSHHNHPHPHTTTI